MNSLHVGKIKMCLLRQKANIAERRKRALRASQETPVDAGEPRPARHEPRRRPAQPARKAVKLLIPARAAVCHACDEWMGAADWTPEQGWRKTGSGYCEKIAEAQDQLRLAGKRHGCPGTITAQIQAGRQPCPLGKLPSAEQPAHGPASGPTDQPAADSTANTAPADGAHVAQQASEPVQ